MKHSILTLAVLAALLAAGCASTAPPPGPQAVESTNGPSMVVAADTGCRNWDRAVAFGPVPLGRQAEADAACLARPRGCGDGTRAIGFSDYAKNVAGNEFANGGFLCVKY